MHLTPALLSSILITATSGGIAMILVIGEARNVGNDTVGELLLVSSAKEQSVDRERIRPHCSGREKRILPHSGAERR